VSRIVHCILYAFLIAMPVLGLLMLSAEGHAVRFWGLTLPSLTGPDKPLADTLDALHDTIGTAGYALIGLHAAAALAHHYVFKDNTLKRMI
jgi:superoxide oxidase